MGATQIPLGCGGLSRKKQGFALQSKAETTLLHMLEKRRHRPHKGSKARWAPIDRLTLLKPLAAPLEEALALALLEPQFVAQQALGEGVWGNDQQVINPEAVGWEGLAIRLRP